MQKKENKEEKKIIKKIKNLKIIYKKKSKYIKINNII